MLFTLQTVDREHFPVTHQYLPYVPRTSDTVRLHTFTDGEPTGTKSIPLGAWPAEEARLREAGAEVSVTGTPDVRLMVDVHHQQLTVAGRVTPLDDPDRLVVSEPGDPLLVRADDLAATLGYLRLGIWLPVGNGRLITTAGPRIDSEVPIPMQAATAAVLAALIGAIVDATGHLTDEECIADRLAVADSPFRRDYWSRLFKIRARFAHTLGDGSPVARALEDLNNAIMLLQIHATDRILDVVRHCRSGMFNFEAAQLP